VDDGESQREDRGTRWSRYLRALGVTNALGAVFAVVLAALAFVPVFRFASVAFARIGYPYELEWMEGGIVDHIRIVLSGQNLYREPSLDFTPFIYAPAYYYVSAAASKVVGLGFLAPRLVSLASVFVSFGLIAWWTYRETGDRIAPLVAAGLFSATYGESAFWFDIARVDSLFLAAVLAGYVLVRFGTATRTAVGAGACLALAALTKQVGFALAVPALAYGLVKSRRQGLWATASFVVLAGGFAALLEATSHGWFSFYVFRVPAQHNVAWEACWENLEKHFWSPVAPMAVAAIAVLIGWVRTGGWKEWALHAAFIVAAIGTSLSSILHSGGYPNVLMPADAAFAIASGLCVATLRRHVPPGGRAWSYAPQLFAVALVAIQVGLLWYPTRKNIPSREDGEGGTALMAEIKAAAGPVWMVSSGYYPYVVRGQPIVAHSLGISDVFSSHEERVKTRLRAQMLPQIRARRFHLIVLDRAVGWLPGDIVEEIKRHYRLTKYVFAPGDQRFWPKVGAQVRPDEIWEPIVRP
jgi:hypothetical protein